MNVPYAHPATLEGIRLTGYASDCTIQGNVIKDMHNGIVLAGGATNNNIVMGNRIANWSTNPVVNSGSNNLVVNNLV